MNRRVGGVARDVSEGLSGGGAACGDEDLVGGETEVRIGEFGSKLTEWRLEIDGNYGGLSGRHGQRRRRCSLSLGVAQ